MNLALTCYRTIEVWDKKETTRLGDDEIYPLVDDKAEIVVRELASFLRDCCCPRTHTRKVCKYCIAYGKFKMQRSFKLHINGDKGIFTCKNDNHPSIYINGGSLSDKLLLGEEFLIVVGTIIYMREPLGLWDAIKMEFHVVATDNNEEEITDETGTSNTTSKKVDDTITDVAAADKDIGEDAIEVTAPAEVFPESVSTPKSLLGSTLIATPISSTPVQIGSVAFAFPVEQHQYSPGLLSNDTIPSFRSAPDPPDSTVKKLISRKDPTGKSPKFRLQSPIPIRSPPPVDQDKESWLQEHRMVSNSKQMMDYSTTNKCKKE